jgi:hypothetical protein
VESFLRSKLNPTVVDASDPVANVNVQFPVNVAVTNTPFLTSIVLDVPVFPRALVTSIEYFVLNAGIISVKVSLNLAISLTTDPLNCWIKNVGLGIRFLSLIALFAVSKYNPSLT